MALLIRFVRFSFRLLLRLAAALLVVLVLCVLFIGFTETGARIAAGKIAGIISKPGQIVAIETPSGLLSGVLRVPEITVADSRGVYARIRDLAVDWSPLSLISGTFKSQLITAGRVDIIRPALPEAPPPETSDAPFQLPVKLDIERIFLPDIMIGKAAAGRDFSISAEGSGKADNQSIIAKVSAFRLDLPDAKAGADFAYIPGANQLKLGATLDEPRDGMLAGLLNLPGKPAMHLAVDGDGPLSDWKGRLIAALDGAQAFAADARHVAVDGGGHRLVLSGNGTAQTLMPSTLRALFAGNTEFLLDATLGTGGKLSVEAGSLTTSAVTVDVSGTYDPNGENDISARASGLNGPAEIRVATGEQETRLLIDRMDLHLQGPAEAARLDFSGKLATVEYPGYRVDLVDIKGGSPALDLRTRTGQANITLSFEQGAFENENLQRLAPGPFTLSTPVVITPQSIAFDKATIESARLGGLLSGKYDLSARSLSTDFQVFALPSVLPDALAAKLKEQFTLGGSLSLGQQGSVALSGIKLKSGILTAEGGATLSDGTLRADLNGALPDLSALLADAKGAGTFKLLASGPLSAPDFDATLQAEKAELSGRLLESLTLQAQGKADPNAPEARITASGKLGGQTINANANLKTEGGITSLPVLALDVGENHLEGALRFSPEFLPEGGISFDLPDIGLVAALAGEKASGDLKGTARFTNTNGISAAVISAKGSGIKRGDVAIKNPVVDLVISDLKALAAQGTITVAEIASGANRLSKLVLAIDRDANETGFDLSASYDGKPLAVKGGVTIGDAGTSVRLSSFSAAPRGISLKLAKPQTILVRDGIATFSDLVIEAGKGSVSVSGRAGATLAIDAEIRSLPLSLANTFSPSLKAEGAVSGTVSVSGSPAKPVVDYKLAFDRAAIQQTRDARLQPFAIKADGKFQDNRLRLNTSVSNGDGLNLKGGGGIAISGNQALDMRFTGSLPFKALSAVFAAQGLEVKGTANLDIQIAGTTAQPVITGRISSSDAGLVDVRRNLAVQKLTLAINLDRNRATIEKLSGSLSTGGTISVSGSVGIAPGSGFPADLKIALSKAAYVDGKVVSTIVDGQLALTGPILSSPLLSGELNLGRSAITIPQKLPASLSKINVQHKNESSQVASQTADVMSRDGGGKGSSSQISLDLVVKAPRIFVQGRGIDAELGGDLTLRGTASDPVVSGGFKMRRGRMTILSRRLDFTSGTIAFGGDLTPTLAMAAQADSGDVTVTVSIDGPANDPSVNFSSSPSLPQDEVLAQLIFQQSLSRLSVLQIAQLADAAAQLAGGRSTSLLQGLRSNLGIDDLDITSDENGQAQVKAGKYLNDRTYIQVEQGASSGSKASINLDVGRGIKLKGEAGTDGGGAAGIFYEKEY